MEIIRKFIYIGVIIIITTLSLSGCKNKKETTISEKISIELTYLDNKIFKFVDKMITSDNTNYKVSTEEEQIKSNQSEQESGGEESSKKDQSSEGSDKESKSGKNEKNSENTTDGGKDTKEITGMSMKYKYDNKLTKEEWKEVENDVESLYLPWSTMQNDLIKLDNINKEYIEKINHNIDNLLNYAIQNDQNSFIKEISNMYSNMYYIAEDINYDSKMKAMLKVKQNITEIYYNVQNQSWDLAQDNLKNTIEILKNEKGIDNRLNIAINNLSYTIDSKEEKIFMAKYTNVINEINNSET